MLDGTNETFKQKNAISFIYRLPPSCHSTWLFRSLDTYDWRHAPTEAPLLPNVMDLWSILGLFDSFRGFVPNITYVATPLSKKLRKDQLQTFDWLDDG